MQSAASPSARQPFPIPPSILLLIHLHLLECPFTTDPACEPQMFDPARRSLVERTRFAEEIIYFLTTRAERESVAKSIFPMYPCSNTSQSTDFRLATLKYLEEARQTALNATRRPVPKVDAASRGAHRTRTISTTSTTSTTSRPLRRTVSQSSTSGTTARRTKVTIKPPLPQINSSKAKAPPTATNVVASGSRTTSSASSVTPPNRPQSESQKTPKQTNGWWWRDVVIRKATLEECTGEKFERLLLAFSIHALMVQTEFQGSTTTNALFDTLSALPISYASLLSRAIDHTTQFDHRITLLDSRTRKILALRKTLDHSKLDTRREDTSIAHLEAVLETKFKDLAKSRGAPWRRDNKAGEEAFELLMQVCGVPLQWMDQAGVISASPDHTHAPSGDNATISTPTSGTPPRNPEPLPTAAANHLAHISTLASLDARLAQISSTQDTDRNEGAPLSVMTDVAFDAETDDFESRLRALEGELEMVDQDVSQKLEEVVEIWGEYVPVNGESERYRFGGGEVLQDVPQPIFEMPEDSSRFPDALRKPPALTFQEAVAAIQQEIQPQGTAAPRETEQEDFIVEFNNLRKELVDMRASEENVPSSPVRPTALPSTPTTARQSRLPVPSPSPWKNAFQPTQKKLATPQTIKKLQFGPLPSPTRHKSTSSFHQSKDSNISDETLREIATPVFSPGRPRADSTPKTIKREQAKRKALNLPAPSARPSISMTPLPSTNISAMFGDIDMTMDQGSTDILPPFTSPWRTPLKSSQTSHQTPRKSVLWGSGTFKRTPLKTGARLSSVVPPVHQGYYLSGVANVQPNVGTPRASIDDACDEIVENLVKESWALTPPGSATPVNRILNSKGKMRANLTRSSPFKSLVVTGKIPATAHSPEMSEDEGNSFEDHTIAPSKFIYDSDEDRGWAGEDEEAGGCEDPVTPRNLRQAFEDQARKSDAHGAPLDASLTLRDILLKAGEAGAGGTNGTFDFDLLDGPEVEVEEEEDEAFEWK